MTVIFVLNSVFIVSAQDDPLVLDVRTRIALRAAEFAAADMPGVYSWDEFRSCSSYASAYLRHLSFPVNGMAGEYSSYPDPFPWSGTLLQTNWVKRNYPLYYHEASLEDFLGGKLWNKINPGDVIYLPAPVGHNGYNTFYHVVVLVGYRKSGAPVFAELAPGSSASTQRSFADMTRFYTFVGTKPYDTGLSTPKSLTVSWFDPLAILNQGKLWQQSGKVVPNSKNFEQFDFVLTVNIYDGATSIFSKSAEKSPKASLWKPIDFSGRDEFIAVVGRLLPANNRIGTSMFNGRPKEIYDSDFGVLISQRGVYQHDWTPQLIGQIESIAYVNGFGGLPGSTDTTILKPFVFSKDNKWIFNIDYSPFTVHKIPDVVNQDMLLRKDLLIKANALGSERIVLKPPAQNLSSGCINYESDSWSILKTFINDQLSAGKKIAIVYSYPDFDQNLIPTVDLFAAPFTGTVFKTWCPYSEDGSGYCDSLDRRNYRKTYLD